MRRPFTLCVAFAALLAASPIAAQSGAPAAAAASDELQADFVPRPKAVYAAELQPVPFELFRGTRIFLRGAIDGTDTQMMLDTGASSTVLDRAFAERLGIKGDRKLPIRGAGGSIPGEIASNVTITVGGLTLREASVIIMDISDVARAIGRPIPVILGHEAIDAGPVKIDFPARAMTFMPATGFVPPEGAIEVPLGHDGPFRTVKLSVAGLPPVDATFDIGNGGTVLLAKSYWEKQKAITALPTAVSQIGGVGGMKPAWRVTLPEVGFAGQTLTAVPAMLNEDPNALPTEGANIGIEMLKPFVVTADYANDRLYLQRSGEWDGFRRERAGVRTELRGDRLRVGFVSPQAPAHAAGLKEGDEIVAIDGQKIDVGFYASPNAEWAMAPAGSPVELTLASGARVRFTLRDYY